MTRATLLAGVVGGVVAVPVILRGGLGGGSDKEHKTGFASLPDAKGWPEPWLAQHYLRDLRVSGGRGMFTLPAGLETTAPAQPMPIFLIDRVCAGASHTLDFSVTNRTLRPGILIGAQSDVDYLAVTCERHGLVLARYGRDGRVVIAQGPHPHSWRRRRTTCAWSCTTAACARRCGRQRGPSRRSGTSRAGRRGRSTALRVWSSCTRPTSPRRRSR